MAEPNVTATTVGALQLLGNRPNRGWLLVRRLSRLRGSDIADRLIEATIDGHSFMDRPVHMDTPDNVCI